MRTWNYKANPKNPSELDIFLQLALKCTPNDRDSVSGILKLQIFRDLKTTKNKVRRTETTEFKYIMESKVEKISKSSNWTHFS